MSVTSALCHALDRTWRPGKHRRSWRQCHGSQRWRQRTSEGATTTIHTDIGRRRAGRSRRLMGQPCWQARSVVRAGFGSFSTLQGHLEGNKRGRAREAAGRARRASPLRGRHRKDFMPAPANTSVPGSPIAQGVATAPGQSQARRRGQDEATFPDGQSSRPQRTRQEDRLTARRP